MEWKDAGAADDVTEDMPLPATVEGRNVGVYLLNGARFHIPTGQCTREPGNRDLACYPARREGDRILVRLA